MHRTWGVIILLAGATAAWGQDQPNPDQLRRMYDDARNQLKQAQDRKNELAAENDKLNARVADLQKQLDAARLKIDDAARASAEEARRTFSARSELGAWQAFISADPKLELRWQLFLENAGPSPRLLDQLDPSWPWASGVSG